MNCDCPRATGIVHYEECPLHDSHSCAVCETENHGNKLIAKQARAEVLAACVKVMDVVLKPWDETPPVGAEERMVDAHLRRLREEIRELQPAAADLEALLDQAHEAALPHAVGQLLKALTEGGKFAVDSPLAKVKKRVEELLREAHLEGHGCSSRLEARENKVRAVYSCGAIEPTGLEKARAIEGEG